MIGHYSQVLAIVTSIIVIIIHNYQLPLNT